MLFVRTIGVLISFGMVYALIAVIISVSINPESWVDDVPIEYIETNTTVTPGPSVSAGTTITTTPFSY